MRANDTYKVRHFLCEACHREHAKLQWNYTPAPVCCDAPMVEGVIGSGATLQIITDDVPGGFTVENGFKTPQTFYSKSEHRAALETGVRNGTRVGRGGCRIADIGESQR